MLRSWLVWRRSSGGAPVPLAMHGTLATVVIWILATAGLAALVLGQLLPWSLGWVERVDPIVARTWFWWFGHPLTYFWLVPTYVLWYTVLPRIAGGKLFSDRLGRAVFVMFILFSTPVGFHHQFADPGIPAAWKMVHTVTTYAILFPSLVTAFTIIASLEVAGRARGGRGLFDWIGKLPWRDPFLLSMILAMLSFAAGGFGGAINAAYAMNSVVHNTAWIHGHFHLTVGTAVTLTFMGACYWLLPRITGRALLFPSLALWQPYLWFFGMVLFAWTSHVTGLMGQPRRVYSAAFLGAADAVAWQTLTLLSAIGGVVLFASSLCFLLVVIGTLLVGERVPPPPIELAEAIDPVPSQGTVWDRIGLWTAVAVVLIALAYAYPLWHLLSMERFGSPAFKPF
jgi:cytochrome c oxidase subunit 1